MDFNKLNMKSLMAQIALLGGLPTAAQAEECVILLHGLARSSTSLMVMEKALESIGYKVVNVGYPSTKGTIDTLSYFAIPGAIKACGDASKIHFVTHSLGGILVRHYFRNPDQKPKNLGRVVMLGPPNKGSPVVDQMGEVPGFDLWNGEAGSQLGTDPDSVPNMLGPVDFDLGVIAGNRTVSPIMSSMIEGENDGKVSVESTKVEGMNDHITLKLTHTFMMNSPKALRQVAHYLAHGRFDHKMKDD